MRRVLVVVGAAAALLAAGCGDDGGQDPEQPSPGEASAAPEQPGEVPSGDGAMSTDEFCREVLPVQLASANEETTEAYNELTESVVSGDEAQRAAALDDFRAEGDALVDGFRVAAGEVADPELGAALAHASGAIDDFVAEVAELAEDGEQLAEMAPIDLDSSTALSEASRDLGQFCEA